MVVLIGGLYDFMVINNLGCLTCLNHTSGNLTVLALENNNI